MNKKEVLFAGGSKKRGWQRTVLTVLIAVILILGQIGGTVLAGASDSAAQGYEESDVREILLGEELTGFAKEEVFYDGEDLLIAGAGVYRLSGELSGKLKISSSKKDEVTLILNGVMIHNEDDEALEVKKTGKVTLVLEAGSENVIISGVERTLLEGTDGAADAGTTEDASGGAVHFHAETAICGTGSLRVEGYLNNGIQCSKDLTIESGDITVTAVNHAIKCNQTLTICDGELQLQSGKDGIHAVGEASEDTRETETQDLSEGTVVICGGVIDIDSYGDAIQAGRDLMIQSGIINIKTEGTYKHTGSEAESFGGPGNSRGGQSSSGDVSEKGLKSEGTLTVAGGSITIDSVDDGVHCADLLKIDGGELTIISGDDGLHSDREIVINDGTIDIQMSYEGIEANQITVNDGDIQVFAYDDGFNANGGSDSFGGPGGGPGGSRGSQASSQEAAEETGQETPNLTINGGNVYVNAAGDGLDSNGNITIAGGFTVVDGPTNSMNGALDGGTENGGEILISGGTIFAGGASGMAETFDASSKQFSFLITFPGTYQEGMEIIVTDTDGTELFHHTPASSGNSIVFSCPKLSQGETYGLRIDAGDEVYDYALTLDQISNSFRASADGSVTSGSLSSSWGGGRMPGR